MELVEFISPALMTTSRKNKSHALTAGQRPSGGTNRKKTSVHHVEEQENRRNINESMPQVQRHQLFIENFIDGIWLPELHKMQPSPRHPTLHKKAG